MTSTNVVNDSWGRGDDLAKGKSNMVISRLVVGVCIYVMLTA
jgi:hypothetical protein